MPVFVYCQRCGQEVCQAAFANCHVCFVCLDLLCNSCMGRKYMPGEFGKQCCTKCIEAGGDIRDEMRKAEKKHERLMKRLLTEWKRKGAKK